jgi:hypothetical protein
MHAPEECHYPIRIFLLQVFVDLQQRKADQLHPELFHLVNNLKLQLVAIAKFGKCLLAGKQLVRIQVDLVIQGPFAVHE